MAKAPSGYKLAYHNIETKGEAREYQSKLRRDGMLARIGGSRGNWKVYSKKPSNRRIKW